MDTKLSLLSCTTSTNITAATEANIDYNLLQNPGNKPALLMDAKGVIFVLLSPEEYYRKLLDLRTMHLHSCFTQVPIQIQHWRFRVVSCSELVVWGWQLLIEIWNVPRAAWKNQDLRNKALYHCCSCSDLSKSCPELDQGYLLLLGGETYPEIIYVLLL